MVSRMIGCLGVNTCEPSWPTGYGSGFVGLHQVSDLIEVRVARPTSGRRVLHGIWHGWITAVARTHSTMGRRSCSTSVFSRISPKEGPASRCRTVESTSVPQTSASARIHVPATTLPLRVDHASKRIEEPGPAPRRRFVRHAHSAPHGRRPTACRDRRAPGRAALRSTR